MARLYQESLFTVFLRVLFFWWIIFTVIEIGNDSALLLDVGDFVAAMYSRVWYIGAASLFGVCFVGLYVYLSKEKIQIDLSERSELGLKTTMGAVPMPVAPAARIKGVSKRLPIADKAL